MITIIMNIMMIIIDDMNGSLSNLDAYLYPRWRL